MSQEQLAPLVRYSLETVASIEQGRRFPTPAFVERADHALDAFGVLKTAGAHLSRQPGLARWFRQWAKQEEEARNLWTYECRVVPGLLQSEAYARAVFESSAQPLGDEQIEEQVTARLNRQRLLRERQNTGYSFIVEESLFLRHTGGVEVTRRLIDHVMDLAELRNVDFQLMPLRQHNHAGLDGPMQLLETPDYRWLAYTEGQRHGHLTSDRKEVATLLTCYAKMRSQALTPEDSLSLLKQLRGEL
jgi:hypothetical protein